MGEGLRDLRQLKLSVRGEADLKTEQRRGDPEADGDSFGARHQLFPPGIGTPNWWAYSACKRCHPPNFMASGPTMRPSGSPASQ